ncbi:hypothetical protein FRC06_009711 [Ceratobasidium sp. 370]|nr:hypothetical protein FRC06_009711 [Ceratobasidium sp. 370]
MHDALPGTHAETAADMLPRSNAFSVLAHAIASLNKPGASCTSINTPWEKAGAAAAASTAMDIDDSPPNVLASTSAMDVDDISSNNTPRTTSAAGNVDHVAAVPPFAQPPAALPPHSPVLAGHAVSDAAESNSTLTATHINMAGQPTQPSGSTAQIAPDDGLRSRLVSIDIDQRTRPRPHRPA